MEKLILCIEPWQKINLTKGKLLNKIRNGKLVSKIINIVNKNSQQIIEDLNLLKAVSSHKGGASSFDFDAHAKKYNLPAAPRPPRRLTKEERLALAAEAVANRQQMLANPEEAAKLKELQRAIDDNYKCIRLTNKFE